MRGGRLRGTSRSTRWGTGAILLVAALLSSNGRAEDTGRGPSPRAITRAIEASRKLAERKLGDATCRQLLTDFRDTSGRPLADGMARRGVDAAEHFRLLYFTSGSNLRKCMTSSILAFTEIGGRVVYVCEARFLALQATDEGRAAHVLIHEALHTLGLGENPPYSVEITRAVERRCAG